VTAEPNWALLDELPPLEDAYVREFVQTFADVRSLLLLGRLLGVTRLSESPESPNGSLGGEGEGDSLTPTLRVSGSESPHPRDDITDSDTE
jgi:hypothetical protein